MENEDITNHFEWAIMLLKHQFDKVPYSLTTDQIEVLKLHHQIETDNKLECRRNPPILFNSGSLAKCPKRLPNWSCGEYALGNQNYWDLENSWTTNFLWLF